MDTSTLFTNFLALFTLLGNILTVLFGVTYFVARGIAHRVMDYIAMHTLWLGFFLSAGSTIGSIIYSEVVGFPACILCWIQRIFMYPLMFLFGLALVRKEHTIAPYTLFLALIGGAVALYNWTKDMLALYGNVSLPCPAVSDLPSCDRIYVLEFGYITIPMIALNAFILIAIVAYARMQQERGGSLGLC